VTIDQLADMIIKISGKNIIKTYDLTAPQGVRGRNADISLTREILGWKPRTALEKGLEKMYKWIEMKVNENRKSLADELDETKH